MISERLASFYAAIEDKWYKFLDFFEGKGLPVYGYADFFDKRGIPSFMATIVLLVLLIAMLFGFVFSSAITPGISISLKDNLGNSLSGVTLKVLDEKRNSIFSKTLSDNSDFELTGIKLGTTLIFAAEKQGYDKSEKSITINQSQQSINLVLPKKATTFIDGLLEVVDFQTEDKIANAKVIASWGNENQVEGTSDQNGKISLQSIPENESIILKISADKYEEKQETISFTSGQVVRISLDAITAGFSGNSKLTVSIFDADTKNPVKNGKVRVFDKIQNSVFSEKTAPDGEYNESIPQGTSINLVVSADGYISYNSADKGEDKTIRGEETKWIVYLQKGGEKLSVLVSSEGGYPISSAAVQLFSLDNNFIDSNETNFGGSVEFAGLKGGKIFATAFLSGYLPLRQLVDLDSENSVILKLVAANSTNSGLLGVGVRDEMGVAANNASVAFFEYVDGNIVPLGIPSMKTSIEGFISARIAIDSNIFVAAQKDNKTGDANIQIKSGYNDLKIQIKPPSTLKDLTVLDTAGNPVNGNVIITSKNGDILFEGKVSKGKVYLDTKGNDTLNVEIEDENGKKTTTQINLSGQSSGTIDVSKTQNAGLNPQIELKKILDSRNQEVEGITVGEFYWLEFSILWPKSVQKGGIHVRMGEDSAKYVDEQEIGVYGFEAANVDEFFLSRSYNPNPLPGNEGIDRQNKGSSANPNKWIELMFNAPEGETIAKIKIKASENSIAKEFETRFRTWAVVSNKYYRTPEDQTLGFDEFNKTKSGLYAETTSKTISVFASTPNCRETICATYSFIGENNEIIGENEFAAGKGKNFGVEISIRTKKTFEKLSISGDTSKSAPKIFFTGSQIDTFSGFGDIAKNDTSISVPDVGIRAGEEKKLRIYFKTVLEGAATIKIQIAGDKFVARKDLPFNIFTERILEAKVVPEEAQYGKDFQILVNDAETKESIINATIKLFDEKNKFLLSIVGNNTDGKGMNGEYLFKNNLDLGNYTAEVSAPSYAPLKANVSISKTGYLQMDAEARVMINKQTKQGSVAIDLKNNSQNSIQDITFELKKSGLFPQEIELTAIVPSSLNKMQKAPVQISAFYTGEDNASVFGQATLIVRGMIEGKYPTSVESKVHVYYNKQLNPDCLKISPPELQASLIGTQGSKSQLEVQIENKCGIPLVLNPKIEDIAKDPNLDIVVQPIQLSKDEIQKVEVNVLNKILRLNPKPEQKTFTVFFDSEQVTKPLYVKLLLLNPMYAIEAPNQLVLWISQTTRQEKAMAQAAIPIRNLSDFDIQNLSFELRDDLWSRNNISVSIVPTAANGLLPKNQVLVPIRFLIAQTNSSKSFAIPLRGQIVVTGQVHGVKSELRIIDAWINVSGYNCLSFRAPDGLTFADEESGYGTISRQIVVQNNCSEEIIVRDLKPNRFGENELGLVPLQGIFIPPNSELRFELQLSKRADYSTENQFISVIGFSQRSGKFIESAPLPFTIKLGQIAGKAIEMSTDPIDVPVCGSTDKIKTIKFPKIANEDCSTGYCDSETMANYLLSKANEMVKKAKSKISQMSNDASNFPGCANRDYCSFSSMGLATTPITAYMQNDSLNQRVLKNRIDADKFDELKGYNVEISAASLEDIARIAGTGYTRQLFLSENISGCGKYLFEINGAAQVTSNRIVAESMVVQIKRTSTKTTMAECLNKIQNILNFLPVDKEYTNANDFGTWMGQIEYESKTKDIAKSFASTLFGTEDRISQNASAYNKMKLITGNVADGIVKFEIDQKGTTDSPKTLTATINDAYNATEPNPNTPTGTKTAGTNPQTPSGTNNSTNSAGQNTTNTANNQANAKTENANAGKILELQAQNNATNTTSNQTNATANNSTNANSSTSQSNSETSPTINTFTIEITDSGLSQPNQQISQNDKIVWNNKSSNDHTLVFGSGIPNLAVKKNSTSNPVQFSNIANITYSSEKYPGIKGTVVVQQTTQNNTETGEDNGENTENNNTNSGTTSAPTTTREKIATEAATALSELAQHQVDGCVSDDESYMILKSFSKFGELKLDGKDRVLLSAIENCIELSVSSEFPEKVKLNTSWKSKEPLTGVESIVLRDIDGKEIGNGKVLALEKSQDGKFEKKFRLCAKGTNLFPEAVNSKITVQAVSAGMTVQGKEKNDKIRRSNLKELGFDACGIHPYDLVKKLNSLGNGTHYATVGWQDSADSVNINDAINALARQKELDKITQSKVGNGAQMGLQEKFKEFISKEKAKAVINGYLSACTGAALICGGLTKGGAPGILMDAALNCVAPATWVLADLFESGTKAKEAISGTWDKFKAALGIAPGEGPAIPATPNTQGETLTQEDWDELFGAAEAGGITRTAIGAITNGASLITTATARIAAGDATSQIMKSPQVASFFDKAPGGMKNSYERSLRKRIYDALMAQKGKKIAEAADGAVKKGAADASADLGDIIAKSAGKLKPTSTLGSDFKAAIGAKTSAVLSVEDLAAVADRTVVGDPATFSTRAIGTVADDMTNAIMANAARDGVTLNRGDVLNTVTSKLRSRLASLGTGTSAVPLTVDDVRASIKGAAGEIVGDSSLKSSVGKAFEKSAAAEVAAAAKLGEDAAAGKIGKWNLKRILSPANKWEFLKGAAKGALCSAIEIGAGAWNYNRYAKDVMKTDPDEKNVINSGSATPEAVDLDGDGKTDAYIAREWNGTLHKNKTYKIAISTVGSTKFFTFSEVNSDDAAREMENLLKEGKASRLDTEYCKGEFALKNLQIIMGSFDPLLKGGATAPGAQEYSDPKIQPALVGAADSSGVDEGILVAAMIEKKLWISSNFNEAIDAEAQKLKQILIDCDKDIDCIFKKYAETEGLNSNNLKKTYTQWQAYRIKPSTLQVTPGGTGGGTGGGTVSAVGKCEIPKAGVELDVRSDHPCISAEFIDNLLKKYNSPAAGSGKYFVQYSQKYGVDDAIALAFFAKESTFGKFGVANKTKSTGNMVCPDDARVKAVNADYKLWSKDRYYCAWNEWNRGIESWFIYITTSPLYFPKGKTTIEKILPIYCPPSECGTDTYIKEVRQWVSDYRSQQQ